MAVIVAKSELVCNAPHKSLNTTGDILGCVCYNTAKERESSMVRVVSKRKPVEQQLDFKGEYTLVDCTSHNQDSVMSRGLSPFFLGRDTGVECYDGLRAWNMENAWQYAKVYKQHTDASGSPTQEYFKWRDYGWSKLSADRHPMGIGTKPLYSLWRVDGKLKHLGYVEAREQIYLPLYATLVVKTEAFKRLKAMHEAGTCLVLADFDGYNNFKTRPKMTWADVLHCDKRKMGHAFVLAMLLERLVSVENGNVVLSDALSSKPAEVASDIMDL